MEREGLVFWKQFVELPQLWQGWDHTKTPIAFFDEKYAVLFGHPNPPDEFQERIIQGIKYHFAETKPVSFTANTGLEYGGTFMATVMWSPHRDAETLVPLVAHEAFHAYQMEKGCPFGQISVAMKYPINNPEVNALAEVEANLLYQAATEKKVELIKAALDARAARQELLSSEVRQFEDEVELAEGLATYIELIAAGEGSKLWNTKLDTLLKLNKDAWGADRLRFYYSGAAWGLLCDALGLDWQRDTWLPQSSIVAKSLGHHPNPSTREFPNYRETLIRQNKESNIREDRINSSLNRAFPGSGVRVEITTKGIPIGGGWNPNTAQTFPGIGRFHPTGLMYIYDTGTEFKVEKDGLEIDAIRHLAFERDDLSILLDGKPITEGGGEGSLEIEGSDCKVKIPRARVTITATY